MSEKNDFGIRKEFRILEHSNIYVGIDVLESTIKDVKADIVIEDEAEDVKEIFKCTQHSFENQTGFLIEPIVVGYHLYFTKMPDEINDKFDLDWIPPERFYYIVSRTIHNSEIVRERIMIFLKDKKMNIKITFKDEHDKELEKVEYVIEFNDLFSKLLK